MYRDVLKILRCPRCGKKLQLEALQESPRDGEVIEGRLFCDDAHSWMVRRGVVNFGATEQEGANNWIEMYKNVSYDELDAQVASKTPKSLNELFEKSKSFIVGELLDSGASTILDIGTGRGMLLNKMAASLSADVNMICADLSFSVLMHDRIKIKRRNPEVKVNYIACDGANLPLADSSVDAAVSFFGIENMMSAEPQGIKEAYRVLKQGKRLLNASIIIDENSRGLSIIKDYNAQYSLGIIPELCVKDGFSKTHLDAGFEEVQLKVIGEGIGEKNETDLIPAEGEWYALVVARCKK